MSKPQTYTSTTAVVPEKEFDPFSVAWAEFENVIGRNYLDVLTQTRPVDQEIDFVKAFSLIQMNRIVRIVYDKKENTLAKLNSLYSAQTLTGASVFILLQNSGKNTECYIGVRGKNDANASISRQTLENSIYGNFPGILQDPVLSSDKSDACKKRVSDTSRAEALNTIQQISDKIREQTCISIVTGVPSLKEDTQDNFSQGLEKIIDALGNRKYSALFLAAPIDRISLLEIEKSYQRLYSDLSMLNISQISLSEQESISFGKSISDGFSETLSTSVSLATTQTCGRTNTVSNGTSRSLGPSIGGVGAAAGAALGTWVFPGLGTLTGAAIGAGVGAAISGLIGSSTHSKSESTTESKSTSKTETTGSSSTTTTTTTATETLSDTKGQAYQYEVKNKRVADALSIIEEQLERIRVAKSYGAWNWAAYFAAPEIETVHIGAEVYSGILRGEKTGVEHCAISYWAKDADESKFDKIIKAVSVFQHPHFNLASQKSDVIVAPTAMLSTQEMAVGMALPQKSIPGLPVFESVEFGRSVTTFDKIEKVPQCKIGYISHFGSESSSNAVELDIDSLTAHTFITGSTGAGKSNAVYMLLSSLKDNNNIPFLVVEPAKGEYKNVFPDVNVFGTNPYLTELLHINPFSFPEQIHIAEHIDRLIEILNAVWPMYAAMPAILKEAVELTYRKCGWNLLTSRNQYSPAVFPDFTDLLNALPIVIDASQYDQEVKSNYAGSLITRVKSLTNGYYRNIFQKFETPAKKLFDESCIVDLSRIGSSETKSMLMGVIFLKLQEYRLSKATKQNASLKHITVLEEAHNLLRRTSTMQGQETANLQGKAVEMITNAIAEMRTYGEGFVIADQAPGLLDESVIRNTNTKIVLRLPDFDDRLLVGKAENLSDAQIDEQARLKTGCASVYQNNWQEAVLCQISKYEQTDSRAFSFGKEEPQPDSRQKADECLLHCIAKYLACGKQELSQDEQILLQRYYPDFELECRQKKLSDMKVLKYFGQFISLSEQIKTVKQIKDFNEWTQRLVRQVFSGSTISAQEASEKDHLLKAQFKLLELQDSKQKDLWHNEIENFEHWRIW